MERVSDEAIDSVESTFLHFKDLMTVKEREAIFDRIRDELVPELESKVTGLEDNYDDPDESPSRYFSDLRSDLEIFEMCSEDSEVRDAFDEGIELIDAAIRRLEGRNAEREEEAKRKKEEEDEAMYDAMEDIHPEEYYPAPQQAKSDLHDQATVHSPRNIFDDVDA